MKRPNSRKTVKELPKQLRKLDEHELKAVCGGAADSQGIDVGGASHY
jgi:hypothetical protein